jgi:hypothetical protein
MAASLGTKCIISDEATTSSGTKASVTNTVRPERGPLISGLVVMDTVNVRQQKEKQTYYRQFVKLLTQEVRQFFKRDVHELKRAVPELTPQMTRLVRELNEYDNRRP